MIQTKRKYIGAALVVLALSLSTIAAAPSSADKPQALKNEQPVSDVLTGNAAGAFAYYAVDYPGDKSVVTIELRYTPADPVTKAGVGFDVYGPNGFLIGRGHMVENTGGAGVLRLEYADSTKAAWLVQVYNYIPDHSISYSIVAQGLPGVEAKATETPAEAAAEPQTPSTVKTTGAGFLAGNHAGAYAFYDVTVAADAPDVAVTMTWSPDDPVIATGVGFVVYGPSGEVRRGAGTGTPGERRASLAADNPGVYRVQIYNYIDGLTIQYALSSAPITE